MYKSIQLLAQLGQNASIKQHQTLQQMLNEQGVSEQEINQIIDSNVPLICAWIPQDDRDEDEDDNGDEDDKEK